MNKVVALSLVSVFLLSILVGYLPVMTTQAAAGNPQAYLVQISPPYYVALVVTNVNLGNPQLNGLIGYELNQTLNHTTVTVSLIKADTGQKVSFTGNVIASSKYAGKFDAYYSPAAQTVIILFALNQSDPSIPMSQVIYSIYRALGISVVNGTYPYLIDAYGSKVYSNGTAILVGAGDIFNSSGTPLSKWTYFGNMNTTYNLQNGNYELSLSVTANVYTATSAAPVAVSSSAVLFAPIKIVNIYNQMMNNQPIGWGRSLINITVYNPLQSSTTLYVYQLNFTGPGPVTVYFYPAVSIFSVDQLYIQRPAVGLYSFTGQGKGAKAFNYTLLIVSYSPINLTVYNTSGKAGVNANYAKVNITFYVNGKQVKELVYLYAITFSSKSSGVTKSNITYNGVRVPVTVISVNSASKALQISNASWFYYDTNKNTIVPLGPYNFNLTLTNNLQLKPFPVTTQLQTAAYEESLSSAYSSVGANQYTGPFFTTPPGNSTITGTYYLTGNATIGKTYTTVYVTGFGTYVFKQLNTTEARISILGTLATPAYPKLNGTVMTGVNIMAQTYNYTSSNIQYVFVNVSTSSFYSSAVGQLNNLVLVGNLFNFTPFYGQYVKYTSVPAVQIISPSSMTFLLRMSPQNFYQALVVLGLWSNMTMVYVTGFAKVGGTWYSMYGTSYFKAIVIPPSVKTSNVTPNNFVCQNAVWVNFYSPDDVLDTAYYNGQYALNVTQVLANLTTVAGAIKYKPGVVGGSALNTTTVYGISVNTVSTNYFTGAQYVNVNDVRTINGAKNTFLVTNYPGISNYTIQSNVPGGLAISGQLPNGVALNWTSLTPGLHGLSVIAPYVLPTPVPGSNVPTPNFNVSVYLRYQIDYAAPAAVSGQLKPGIYYGPQNSIVVVTPPNLTVGTKLTISFASGDYAVQYYFMSGVWNRSVTIVVPNATLTLKAPSVAPLYNTGVPIQVIEPYYAMPYPAQLAIGTNEVTMVANSYSLFGVTPKANAVGVGKFMNITIKFANGTTERIYLTGNNVTTLFQGGVMNENASCSGAYNATISIQGLMNILHLTSVSQLNGACLYITYYDNITHATATAKICFGGVSAIAPVQAQPAYIFYVLTAKYINATFGYPVTLAQSVAVQPRLALNDTFLAKALAGVVANLNVTNVTIVDHYGNKYMIYYSGGKTVVSKNGQVVQSFSGYLLPTIPETAPNSGIFNGTPITFVINMPGTIYKNGTVCNGTLAVKLGNNVVTLGPATNFALPAFSFAAKLFGYNSTMYVTVMDPASGSTATLKTYIAAYNITPIRIAPVTIPVPMPANASIKIQYVYNQPITLTPTNQYIVIHVTSIINYTYVFYIATVVQPGKNTTTTPPVLVNFQTVVPVPVIGPGIVAQVPVQFSQIGALGSGYYTVTMFAVPFAGGPVISLYPAKLVFTNVYVNTTVV